ncbi:MAG TPA: PH domain-containing protein [Stellaceae bacterium]|nr:PH domain-containing protein [Stellaceae bacterium]
MLQDPAPDFESVREPGETILWQGRPVFWPFALHTLPILVFGAIWGFMLFGGHIQFGSAHGGKSLTGLPLLFTMVMDGIPVWISLGYCAYVVLVQGNTVYAYTNRRLMMRGGVFGTSFKSIDYDRIQELDVVVGIIDRLFNVGTVRAFCGATTQKGARIYDRFVSIPDPYEVYKGIKGVEVDVKTDWNFPNAMRPATNPGFKTAYTPR